MKTRIIRQTAIIASFALLTLAFMGCTKTGKIPSNSTKSSKEVIIVPDYTNVTIPANIAPMNFKIGNDGDEFVVEAKGKNGQIIVAANKHKVIKFNQSEWKKLLEANRGGEINFTIYAKNNGNWETLPSYTNFIAEENIDPYLSYRLIEPGETAGQIGIYQRNLETFEEKPIYENGSIYSSKDHHCMNCHTYKNNDATKMFFHVRFGHSGTIFVDGDRIEKVQVKTDSTFTAGVYPSWHPFLNKVAFSINDTRQMFHIKNQQKTEVFDTKSDLIIYDVDTKEVSPLLTAEDEMETYPAWNTAGDTLYYCSYKIKHPFHDAREFRFLKDSIFYDLKYIPYDIKNDKFGEPGFILNAAELHVSVNYPRVSPDGRYILCTIAPFGQFHLWHSEADLFCIDLRDGNRVFSLKNANSTRSESVHSWSSNSRWIAFASRRDDGYYTRTYFCYFDKNGNAHKAFLLPQEEPDFNKLRLKSYNLPELTKNAVEIAPREFKRIIYETEAVKAKHKPLNK